MFEKLRIDLANYTFRRILLRGKAWYRFSGKLDRVSDCEWLKKTPEFRVSIQAGGAIRGLIPDTDQELVILDVKGIAPIATTLLKAKKMFIPDYRGKIDINGNAREVTFSYNHEACAGMLYVP